MLAVGQSTCYEGIVMGLSLDPDLSACFSHIRVQCINKVKLHVIHSKKENESINILIYYFILV